MPRQPKQARAIATVNAIITAGFIGVSRIGKQSVTTQMVVDIAGVGIGSFYEYFNNKEELFAAMQKHFIHELIAHIKPNAQHIIHMELPAAVRAILMEVEHFMSSNGGYYIRWAKESIINMNDNPDTAPLLTYVNELAIDYIIQHPELAQIKALRILTHVLTRSGLTLMISQLSDPSPKFESQQIIETIVFMIDSTLKQAQQLEPAILS